MGVQHRLILAEVAAARRQNELLLMLISDLNQGDVDKARRDSDRIAPYLLGEKVWEMRRALGRTEGVTTSDSGT
jgi:hypothetical protein